MALKTTPPLGPIPGAWFHDNHLQVQQPCMLTVSTPLAPGKVPSKLNACLPFNKSVHIPLAFAAMRAIHALYL